MLGAIIGDIIGSPYEFKNIKGKELDFFTPESTFTDDTVLTVATASAIMEKADYGERYGRYFSLYNTRSASYTGLGIGFGPMFVDWGQTPENLRKPYNSYGNGSAMRVSPIAWAYDSLFDVLVESQLSACPTHNHIEGIKAAQATASCIFMARQGYGTEEIKVFIESYFGYNLDFDLDDLNEDYKFNATAPGSVPQALFCSLSSSSFQETMQNCLYIGGDTDTIAAIAGSISEAVHGIPTEYREKALAIIEKESPSLKGMILEFESRYPTGKLIKRSGQNSLIDNILSRFRK
jgi:ADP-ribosyl-[dinitrogen reductase] hydrolase